MAFKIIDTQKYNESIKNEDEFRAVVEKYTDDEAARILAHMDDTSQGYIDLARKASGLERQVSVEVRSSKQTVQDMKDFQAAYDQKIRKLTTALAKSEMKHIDAEPASPALIAAAQEWALRTIITHMLSIRGASK